MGNVPTTQYQFGNFTTEQFGIVGKPDMPLFGIPRIIPGFGEEEKTITDRTFEFTMDNGDVLYMPLFRRTLFIKVLSIVDNKVTILHSPNGGITTKEYSATADVGTNPLGICLGVDVNEVFLKFGNLPDFDFTLFLDKDNNVLTIPNNPKYCIFNCLEIPFTIDVFYTFDNVLIETMDPGKKYSVKVDSTNSENTKIEEKEDSPGSNEL